MRYPSILSSLQAQSAREVKGEYPQPTRLRTGPKGLPPMSTPKPELSKRQRRAGQFTFFGTGDSGYLGMCGKLIQSNDFVVAMPAAEFSLAACGKQIQVVSRGKLAVATVKDHCPSCGLDQFDMTTGLFQFFVDVGEGKMVAEWEWIGGEPPSPPSPSAWSIGASSSTSKSIQSTDTGTSNTPTASGHNTSPTNTSPASTKTAGVPEDGRITKARPIPVGAAIGAAIGALLVIIMIFVLIRYFRRRQAQRKAALSESGRPEPFTAPGLAALAATLPVARYMRSKNTSSRPESSGTLTPRRQYLHSKTATPSNSHSSRTSSEHDPPSLPVIREVSHEDSGVRIPSETHQSVQEVVLEHPPPYTIA